MTLDEAIKHAEEVMVKNLEKTKDRNASDPIAINCFECAEEHQQLAEWLRDYKRLKEQEPCGDAISREDALKALAYDIKSFEFKSGVGKNMNEIAKLLNTIYEIQSDNIKALPPVQPKIGYLIYEKRKRLINETDEGAEYVTDYWCKCSRCGGDFGYRKMEDAFCKYCGAKMVELQESEDKE